MSEINVLIPCTRCRRPSVAKTCEHCAAYNKNWKANNLDKVRASGRRKSKKKSLEPRFCRECGKQRRRANGRFLCDECSYVRWQIRQNVKPANIKKWRQENAEHVRQYTEEYRAKNSKAMYEKAMAKERQWRQEHPELVSRRNFLNKLKRYHITEDQFFAILEIQGGCCVLCRSDKPTLIQWTIDHDHLCCPDSCKSCGKCVRGILCGNCNSALGYLKDKIEAARAIPDYLLNPPARSVLRA
jgi:recombination endonuclease VII